MRRYCLEQHQQLLLLLLLLLYTVPYGICSHEQDEARWNDE